MTHFACCLAACALTLHDAAALLAQSHSSVEKKSRGAREMTANDARILSGVWHRIRQGRPEDLVGLPEGAIAMASTMRILRGVNVIVPSERKKTAKNTTQATIQSAIEPHGDPLPKRISVEIQSMEPSTPPSPINPAQLAAMMGRTEHLRHHAERMMRESEYA